MKKAYACGTVSILLPVLIGDTEDTGRAYLKVRTDRDRPAARVSELETSGAVSGGFSEKEYDLPAGSGRTGNERISDKILSGSLPYSVFAVLHKMMLIFLCVGNKSLPK